MFQDLRYGARMLLKHRGLSIVAALTLALGIGVNTGIFSVINGVLLRPLPGYETGRLVIIWGKTPYSDDDNVTGPVFKEWRKQAQSFERIEAGVSVPCSVTGIDAREPVESVEAVIVTPGYFSLYRAQAAMGRLFLPGEDSPGRDHVVVLDPDYWRRRFSGDPDIVGKTIHLNREEYVVVGVAPSDFHPLGRGRAFYLPLAIDKYSRTAFWVVARLKAGVNFEQAKAEMAVISQRLRAADPKNYENFEANPVPILETWVAQIRPVLLLLFAGVAVVLLIACANVANLLLARAAARRQEFAIRLALGASRFRLMRQMAVESLLLAIVGGGIGLSLAVWGVSALGKLKWLSIPRLDEMSVDWSVLGFNFLAMIITGLLCSAGPALVITRQDVSRGLESGGRGFAGSRAQNRTRHALIVAEIAGAFTLLYVAGLLTQSFSRMQRVDLGYDPRNVLTFSIILPETTDPDGRQFIATYDRIAERLRRLPGVEHVGLTTCLPTGDGDGFGGDIRIEGRPEPPNNEANATLRVVSADYFLALRVRLLAGRLFDERDIIGRPDVIIINQSVARRFFPDRSPIGQRLLGGRIDPNMRAEAEDDSVIAREIIGVVGDVKQTSVTDEGKLEMIAPYSQNGLRYTMIAVRTTGDPMKLTGAVRQAVAQEDKDLPIADVKTMEERASSLTAQSRTSVMIFGVFAALALLLAAIGVYGVMAYAVTQRTREIGVRMALGAKASDVRSLVLRQGSKIMLIGLVIGSCSMFAVARLLTKFLFGVKAVDPGAFAGVTLLLALVTLAACFIPARRATKVDPLTALRSE
ncbi:MAG: ABC transporter permease [Chloracidobacterium sp.]|nr:ABC transporter permease [Chloracidobacterium sp.]